MIIQLYDFTMIRREDIWQSERSLIGAYTNTYVKYTNKYVKRLFFPFFHLLLASSTGAMQSASTALNLRIQNQFMLNNFSNIIPIGPGGGSIERA